MGLQTTEALAKTITATYLVIWHKATYYRMASKTAEAKGRWLSWQGISDNSSVSWTSGQLKTGKETMHSHLQCFKPLGSLIPLPGMTRCIAVPCLMSYFIWSGTDM